MPEVTEQQDEELARAGLAEITAVESVGELTSRAVADDGVVTLTFAATMLGYPGWHWTVALAEIDGEPATVLEAELLPGDGALLAPEWVPWSDRLEEYRATQAAAGHPDDTEEVADAEHELDDDELDDLGDDPDDGIDFESPAVDEPGALADPELAGLPEVGVDEQDEADPEADEDRPEPPPAPRRQNRRKKKE